MESVHPAALIAALIGVTLWHELGHIVAARMVRTPIRRISFGLGPVIWRRPLHRETDLLLRALPLGMSIAVPARRTDGHARPRHHDAWMAAGGPLASFLLTGLLFALARWGGLGPDWGFALVGVGLLSAVVALLNLVPLPGLDGGHLLALGLSRSGLRGCENLERRMTKLAHYGVTVALLAPLILVFWRA